MGLLDGLAKKLGGPVPDYGALIKARLEPGDDYLAHCSVLPTAYERGGGHGMTGMSILGSAINKVEGAVSRNRHIGGEAGSVAHSLARDVSAQVLTFGSESMTWWDFGLDGRSQEPRLAQRVERRFVTSIEGTGKKAQGGPIVRFTFADDSFFDYTTLKGSESPTFDEVARTYGTPS